MKIYYNIRMPKKKTLDCDIWEKNKKLNPERPINPMTGRKIYNTSITYKKIEKECFEKYKQEKKGLEKQSDKRSEKQSDKRSEKGSEKGSEKKSEKGSKKGKHKPLKKNIDSLTLEDCKKWDNLKRIKNPLTGYRLKENSQILKKIVKQCIPMLDKIYNDKTLSKNKDITQHNSDKKSSSSHNKSITPKNSPKKSSSSHDKSLIPQNINDIKDNDFYYPSLDDKYFREKLTSLQEFYLYKVKNYPQIKSVDDFNIISNNLCSDFEKTLYQYFISNYVSNRTPYKSILLYHGVGVGKTCSAITLSEGFLSSHSLYDEPKIWVIMPLSLKNSFKEQIFSLGNLENLEYLKKQCTGDLYIKLAHISQNMPEDKAKLKLKKLIKSRYRLFTYEGFTTFIENEYEKKGKIITDKVIIIDEAHNIRSSAATETNDKKILTLLSSNLKKGNNNRLVLLSATPMYNKPEDIYDLLQLLLINDKRYDGHKFPNFFNENNIMNTEAVSLIKKYSSNYISYLRGKNPFTFAIKLSPRNIPNNELKILTKECEKDSINNPIPNIYKNWIKNLDDDIVLSKLAEKQLEYISKKMLKEENNIFNNIQPMNIVYDNAVGESGFNTFFTRTNQQSTMTVRYNKKYIDALYPNDEKLGLYSGKFLNICNIIKNTHGVVVIYSSYIWAGIIPIACCLEHMGFNREATKNILNNPKIIPDPPKYDFKDSPKYCILSSENSDVMGSTSIDALLKKINHPDNHNGSLIKVILITPVASEGLSFYNVREIHIVEPWFHFNKVTQVIGRGIRNCRHQKLPLAERNVMVYMHASYNDEKVETADIHAFRIASKKYIECKLIDKLIRDNALDCFLMKNINYFPKSLFEFGPLKIKTSNGTMIDFKYGDDEINEPQCKEIVSIKSEGYRKDAYKHFIIDIQNKIKKIILYNINNNNYYISFKYIIQEIKFEENIIYEAINDSIYPNVLIDGYILVLHDDGIHIIKIEKEFIKKIRITKEEKVDIKKDFKMEKINVNDIPDTIIKLYLSMSSEHYANLMKKIIETNSLGETDAFIAKCFYIEGALISKDEIKSFNSSMNEYIGYVNIFNIEFEPIIYHDNIYRDLIEREKVELISNRRKNDKPVNMDREKLPWGIISPTVDKKQNKTTNVFKILTSGSSTGNKTGIVCTSLNKKIQEDILKVLGNDNISDKVSNCKNIALDLYIKKRITIYPEYKPII